MRPSTKAKLATIDSALTKLRVTAEEVSALPTITKILEKVGQKETIFEYLRGSEDPDARRIIELSDGLDDEERERVPIEAYCAAIGITTKRLLEIITGAVFEQSSVASALIAAAAHPEVVRATALQAMGPDGSAERRMMHMHRGFLPVPKTSVVHVHGPQTIDARQQAVNVNVLPPVEDAVKRMTNRFNAQLGGATPALLPEPPPIEELEAD